MRALGSTYKMDNLTISSNAPEGQTSDAILRFKSNGIVEEIRDNTGGTTTTTDSEASPWSDLPGEDGSSHHVRLVSHDSGTNRYTGTPTLGTWTALTSDIDFDFQDPDTTGPYSGQSTYTFALSDDGGSTTLDTLVATINLDNEGP